MYLRGMCFGCNYKNNALGAVGIDWLSMAGRMLTGSGGGGGGGGAANTNTNMVTTTTTVSPQISPIFVQQQQPENSPVNATSSMVPAPSGLPGALPGFDAPLYSANVPNENKIAPIAIAAALVGLAMVLR